jgi:lysophospholipase L1-like esterase
LVIRNISLYSCIIASLLILSSFKTVPKSKKLQPMHSYLALGDSYTIGELVPYKENFPHQAIAMLQAQQMPVSEPVIVATTGWTTDELATAIREKNIQETFDIVTLLIGVNNQYRGRGVEEYKTEFTNLLLQAIAFARGNSQHVFVLSIPDWGCTPFAADRDAQQIAKEIDAYNAAKRAITKAHNCHYINITPSTRAHAQDPNYLATDGLHPSAKEYKVWAAMLADEVKATYTQP